MNELPSVRLGVQEMEAPGMAIMVVDNDGTTDGLCSMKGSYGKYYNDLLLNPLHKWGIK